MPLSASFLSKIAGGLVASLLVSCKPGAHPPSAGAAPPALLAAAESPTAPPPRDPAPASASAPPAGTATRPAAPTTTDRPPEKGVFYVIKAFSLTTDSGIYGFPVGTRVTLVREEDGKLVVSDGIRTAPAPKGSLSETRVPVSARPVARSPQSVPGLSDPATTPSAPAAPVVSALLAAKQARLRAQEAEALEKKRARLQEEIASLKSRIAAAEAEIPDKQSRQRPRRYYYDAYGNLLATQNKSAYTLSADASNLDGLRKKHEARKAELAGLPEPGGP